MRGAGKTGRKGKGGGKSAPENIWNVPNSLTLLRVILTFATIYCIFAQYKLVVVAILFAVGMITDFLDGQIARRYKLETEFGRKFDIIADRFLLLGVAFALAISYSLDGTLTRGHLLELFLVMSREIISFPFALIAFMSRKPLPDARFIGKLTTCLQGFAVPWILLSAEFQPFGNYSWYIALVTCIVGIISAIYYINDVAREGIA